jgi:ParB family chromosome partitioning protein
VIETIGRFLDPIVAVREDGQYLTPNGNHRLQALKKLGLALNTEKTHNLREKSLETIRMALALVKFNVDRVKGQDVAKSGGGAPDEE